jgi:hypothetical protein
MLNQILDSLGAYAALLVIAVLIAVLALIGRYLDRSREDRARALRLDKLRAGTVRRGKPDTDPWAGAK